MDVLQVGYAQKVITPSLARSVYLAGFGRDRQAETVHDDLWVRAVALTHGPTRLVLAAMDLIGLSRHHCLEIARRVTAEAPEAQVILVSTHTHHGPDTLGLWGPNMRRSGVDPAYMAELKDKVTATALAALERLEPARLASNTVHVDGVAKNARNPRLADISLTCLRFTRPESGAPLVTLAIFPCHPEVLWDENTAITADYPGYLRDWLEAWTDAPALFLPGALGGMMTPDVEEHSFAEAQEMGATLARAALQALEDVVPAEVAHVTHRRTTYEVRLTNPLFKLARLLGTLPKEAVSGRTLTTEANLLQLDATLLLTGPGEILPRLGFAGKRMLRGVGGETVAIIGLANDELGYILPEQDFAYPLNPFRPGDHYEETMSVGKQAGPALLGAWRELLDQAPSDDVED